jgi:hypothetical protein
MSPSFVDRAIALLSGATVILRSHAGKQARREDEGQLTRELHPQLHLLADVASSRR